MAIFTTSENNCYYFKSNTPPLSFDKKPPQSVKVDIYSPTGVQVYLQSLQRLNTSAVTNDKKTNYPQPQTQKPPTPKTQEFKIAPQSPIRNNNISRHSLGRLKAQTWCNTIGKTISVFGFILASIILVNTNKEYITKNHIDVLTKIFLITGLGTSWGAIFGYVYHLWYKNRAENIDQIQNFNEKICSDNSIKYVKKNAFYFFLSSLISSTGACYGSYLNSISKGFLSAAIASITIATLIGNYYFFGFLGEKMASFNCTKNLFGNCYKKWSFCQRC